jgi:hypothetical protein
MINNPIGTPNNQAIKYFIDSPQCLKFLLSQALWQNSGSALYPTGILILRVI